MSVTMSTPSLTSQTSQTNQTNLGIMTTEPFDMFNLDRSNAIEARSSTGWLLKWRLPNPKNPKKYIWVKTPGNIVRWDGTSYAEILASMVCWDLNIRNFLVYRPCIVNLKDETRILCCESDDFCHEDEIFVSITKLLKLNDMKDMYDLADDSSEYKRFLKDMSSLTGLNFRTHMEDMMFLDYLICNFDRNLWNLGILCDPVGGMRLAPIFDSGDSFHLERFEDGVYNRSNKFSPGKYARPFIKFFDEQVKLIRPERVYETNFQHTFKALDWLSQNFTESHNVYDVDNALSDGCINYIKSMLTTNYEYYQTDLRRQQGSI